VKKMLLKSALVLGAISGLLAMVGCDKPAKGAKDLAIPENVQIAVVNRTMTVTWDAVPNAQGYEIITTSTGCGSGNKIINTKANTATNLEGNGAYLKDDGSNGAVVIKEATTIEITLMSKDADTYPNTPMASAVSAKVKALNDSAYSSVTEKTLSGGM